MDLWKSFVFKTSRSISVFIITLRSGFITTGWHRRPQHSDQSDRDQSDRCVVIWLILTSRPQRVKRLDLRCIWKFCGLALWASLFEKTDSSTVTEMKGICDLSHPHEHTHTRTHFKDASWLKWGQKEVCGLTLFIHRPSHSTKRCAEIISLLLTPTPTSHPQSCKPSDGLHDIKSHSERRGNKKKKKKWSQL